jgi:hypothetical protein
MEMPVDLGPAVLIALFVLAVVIFGVVWRSIGDD